MYVNQIPLHVTLLTTSFLSSSPAEISASTSLDWALPCFALACVDSPAMDAFLSFSLTGFSDPSLSDPPECGEFRLDGLMSCSSGTDNPFGSSNDDLFLDSVIVHGAPQFGIAQQEFGYMESRPEENAQEWCEVLS